MIVTVTSAYGDYGREGTICETTTVLQGYRATVAVFGATLSCLWQLDCRGWVMFLDIGETRRLMVLHRRDYYYYYYYLCGGEVNPEGC